MPDHFPDHELFRGIERRDIDALRRLFERYAPLMLAVAGRMLRDEHEAEDVVSEVFWEIWNKPERFVAERGAPRTYLMLIVRSRSIDRLRSRRSGISGQTLPGPAPDAPDHAPTPEHLAEHRETAERVRHLLSELPDGQRQAVTLSFFDGLTHKQISEQTDQPLGTVKGRIRQGLIRLRDLMRKQRGGESP